MQYYLKPAALGSLLVAKLRILCEIAGYNQNSLELNLHSILFPPEYV